MVNIGRWSIKKTPKRHHFERHNYVEKYMIFYKQTFCGFVYLCSFDSKWWVRITNEKIRKKFYKDSDKFYRESILQKKNRRFCCSEKIWWFDR